MRSNLAHVEGKVVLGLILDYVVCSLHNSKFSYALSNPQKMHYKVSNNYGSIHASQNICGCIQVAIIIRYL